MSRHEHSRGCDFNRCANNTGKMQTLLLLTLLFVARLSSGDNTCAVYDEHGIKLGSGPHFMGTFPADIKPGNVLPGRLRLENFRAATVKSGTCDPDLIEPDLTSDWLRFEVTEKFRAEGMSGDGCVFVLQMERGEGCPDVAGTEFTLEYAAAGEGTRAPIFAKENYTFQMSFPVSKGTVINTEDIIVTTRNVSAVSLELQDPFDGIEIVRLDSSTDQTHRFQLKTNKLLYMLEDLRSALVAKSDHGGVNSTVPFTLRMSEDSAVPKAEFEKSFYDVTVQASHLNPGTDVFPAGAIKLKEGYQNLSLDVRTLNDPDLYFEVSNEEDIRVVDVRLTESPTTNLTSRDVFLQVTARLTNVFGRESEASAFLLVRVIGNPGCVHSDLVENKEQMAMIILSIIVAILLLAIIYLYYKYVRARKSLEPAAEEASPHRSVKNRRPTPRVISEYPYPLEKLPKPLETLAETEEDGTSNHGKFVEIKIVSDEARPKPKISTRKRSVTFLESDAESRQVRESVDLPPAERKASGGSDRRSSRDEEERRRRKSSVKMYRCLT